MKRDLLLSAPCLGAPISRDFKDYSAQIHKETPPCECVIILAAKKKFKGNQKIAHLVTRKTIKILTLSVYQNIRHLQGLSSTTPPP